MAKVFFAVKEGKLVRNNKYQVAEIANLDTTPVITFADKAEETMFQEYVAGLKKMGKEAPGQVTPQEAVTNLSKLLLADGREKPYLKLQGAYGEYTPKRSAKAEKKTPKTKDGKDMTRDEVVEEFLANLLVAINKTEGVSESMRVMGGGAEIAYKGLVIEISPKVTGKMRD